jgi:hypothetical protein
MISVKTDVSGKRKSSERYMKILVTGASGFIGGRFARFALEQGLDVRVNGRRAEGVEHLVRRGAEFIQGDLTDADWCANCAPTSKPWCIAPVPSACGDAIRTFTRATCRSPKTSSKPASNSACGAWCICRRRRSISMAAITSVDRRTSAQALQASLRRDQIPGRAKVFGAQEFGLETMALRPRFVTGAGDMSIFPRLLNMQRKGRLAIIGDGLNKVDFTSVQNLNEALLSSLLAAGSALGKAYNISNGAPVPLWDVVNYVMRKMEVPQVTGTVPTAWPTALLRSMKACANCGRAVRSRPCRGWACRS